MPVPKLVHQTWKDHNPPAALRPCVESFSFLNPGWTVRYYTDEDCLKWVDEVCPQLKGAYLGFPKGIHRADLFRILVLYYEGGVYADLDVECIRPLDELLARLDPTKTTFLTRDHPVHEHIHFKRRPMFMNDFMIAQPGAPLLGEILTWMLRCPPVSKNSANAVMDTGPGILSSVIELLGGAEQVPGLQVMPTPWIHSLPDMNCQFPEAHFYRQEILSRSWLKRDVHVVHYWYHTWVEGMKGNTLTDHADVLLSTLGEQVERKLQWLLRDTVSETDAVIACALAEFAEMHGTVLLWVDREADPVMDRFLDVLDLTGLRPKMLVLSSSEAEGVQQRVTRLKERGATTVRQAQLGQAACNGRGSKVLLVAAPAADLNEHWLGRHLGQAGGLVLGPVVEWGTPVTEAEGLRLSEVHPAGEKVPRVAHLLPDHGLSVTDIAESLAEHDFSIRQWTAADAQCLLEDMTLGVWNWKLVPPEELRLLRAMAILYVHGGVVFESDGTSPVLPAQLHRDCRTTFCHGASHWLIACPPRSEVVAGAVQHWISASRKGKASHLKKFIHERVSALLALGHARDLHASHVKAHPLLP